MQLGALVRRGVLEKVEAKPGQGTFADPSTGGLGPGGTNLDVTLGWRWSGTGAPRSFALLKCVATAPRGWHRRAARTVWIGCGVTSAGR